MKAREKELIHFLNALDLNIKNLSLLNKALTHSSYVKRASENNEQLEFFGDAVLKLYISEYLMEKYPQYDEGTLSSLRACIVSEKVLSKIATSLNLKKYLLLGKNERKHLPNSILADALEALLAVIYYECGESTVKQFILSNWLKHIESADRSKEKDNYKAILQEYSQSKGLGLPVYKTISETGPDHNKKFEINVYLNDNELARGTGKTKKEASQEAAKYAMKCLYESK